MIVYQHKKADTGEIFYVGIGVDKYRANQKHNRNKLWNKIYNKHGRTVEIISENCTHEEACQIEQYLIAYYGRICLNTGCLANITDGGEGTLGFKHSQDTKAKMSKAAKNKDWTYQKKRIAEAKRMFTNEQIKFIKENYIPRHKVFGQKGLGKMFNTSQTVIFNIINNNHYKDV